MGFDVYTVAGAIGSAIIIAAYLANQMEWMNARDWRYSVLNLVGSVLILISLYAYWNLAAAVIEAFWAAISIYGLLRTSPWRRAG